MEQQKIKDCLENGRTSLGVEFGSTRIKAVLIGEDHTPLASGAFSWENRLEDGVWTYRLEDAVAGLQSCYRELADSVFQEYGVTLHKIGSIGISAMMHGYLPFDKQDNLLVPFRTWRNTMTAEASEELTALLNFNIPQRWSAAHLYQSILKGEAHLPNVAFLTTLAGYIHWILTGEKVLGVGEASGMFPIDSAACDYDEKMLVKFDAAAASHGFQKPLRDLLPKVLSAGENAGVLTAEGAKLLDPSGAFLPGAPFCPPEGDAGTGMVATNSVAPRTGNVSAGTSIFSMAVLEKPLTGVYPEIDMVTTPTGAPVAMVHCNTCTSDLDAWIRLFSEVLKLGNAELSKPALYDAFYEAALQGDKDCGGLVSYNCYAGEPVAGLSDGRPLFLRRPESALTLPNFARTLLFSTMATLRLGMDILFEKEHIALDRLCGHGGLFKTPLVGQKLLAGAMHTPVVVMETAGEGGAWGIALLASYLREKQPGETLESYLAEKVFGENAGSCVEPDEEDVNGFNAYMTRYRRALPVEEAAVKSL